MDNVCLKNALLVCVAMISGVSITGSGEQHIKIINNTANALGVDLTVPARTEALVLLKKIQEFKAVDVWQKVLLYDLEIHDRILSLLQKGEVSAALDLIKKGLNEVHALEYMQFFLSHCDKNDVKFNSDFIQELIRQGYNPNNIWQYLAHLPCYFAWNFLDVFLKNGADQDKIVEVEHGKFLSPLLICMGIDLSHYDKTYKKPFASQYVPLRMLIKSGANVNLVVNVCNSSDESWTPLLWAIYIRNFEYVKMLLDAGADVNQQATPCPYDTNSYLQGKQNPLSFAFNMGLTEIVRLLIEHGATL